MTELETILQTNAARRERELEQARREAEQAADVIDRMTHPNETDAQREQRRQQEAERQRLTRLGVMFR